MGFNIGANPTDLFNGMLDSDGNQAKKISNADFNNQVVLLTFIHVDYHTGSGSWMKNLMNIQNSVKMIAVIFSKIETVTQFNVTKPFGCNFQLILNDAWINPNYNNGGDSFAKQYIEGFNDGNLFTGAVSNEVVSFLLSKDHLITDKWHKDSTAKDNPISFNHIPPAGTFVSTDFANTETFLSQRITNLNANPTILYTEPAEGNIFTLNHIALTKIIFSKPVNAAAANTDGNYILSGTGGSSLSIDADYTGTGVIENVASLTIGGSLGVGDVSIKLEPPITDTNTPPNGLTDNEINFTSVVPTNVQATNGTDTDKVEITWNSVTGANSYKIYRDGTQIGMQAGTSFNDTTATPGVPYSYTVKAHADAPYNADSALSAADTGYRKLSAPTGVLASDGSSTTQITITWNSVTGADSYIVKRNGAQIATPAASPYNDTANNATVVPGTLYTYTVAAHNTDAGAVHDSDDSAGDTGYKKLSAPTGVSASDGTYTDRIRITWNVVAGADQYIVKRNGAQIASGITTLSYDDMADDTIVVPGTVYTYTVIAHNTDAGAIHDSDGTTGDTGSKAAAPPGTLRDIVLVMDISGSMKSTVAINSESKQKIEWTKIAACQFIDEWSVWAGTAVPPSDPVNANDRYGIVHYSTTADKTTGSPVLIVGHATEAKNAINGLSAGGTTAMGAGLAHAFDLVDYSQNDNNYGRKRYFIQYADGQQNVLPYVVFNSDSPTSFDIDTDGTSSNCPPGMHTITINNASSNIPIYTISIGDNTPWLQTLSKITTVAGGVTKACETLGIWPLVGNAFTDILTEIYGNSSPQLIFRTTDTIPSGSKSKTHSVLINRSIRKIMVSISWLGNFPLKISLRKGSKTITSYDASVSESKYCIALIKIPYFKPVSDNYGSWDVIVERKTSSTGDIPYNVSVIGDEKEIKINPVKIPELFWTGDELPLGVKVKERRRVVLNLKDIKASVSRPVVGQADVLAQYFNNLKSSTLSYTKKFPKGEAHPVAVKLDQLYANKEARAKLLKRDTKQIALTFAQKKVKSFPKETYINAKEYIATVPGIYRVEYRIEGKTRSGDQFQRMISRSFVVTAKPDASKTKLAAKYDDKKKIFTVSITAMDAYGNLAGPGYSDYIISRLGKIPSVEVADNLNGTYTVKIRNVQQNDLRKRLQVNVLGQRIFNGYASDLVKPDGKTDVVKSQKPVKASKAKKISEPAKAKKKAKPKKPDKTKNPTMKTKKTRKPDKKN